VTVTPDSDGSGNIVNLSEKLALSDVLEEWRGKL